jgi:hypothetical protein
MSRTALDFVGISLVAVLAASPAFAGTVVTPEPEVAGGLIAIGLLGLGYRLLRRRISR